MLVVVIFISKLTQAKAEVMSSLSSKGELKIPAFNPSCSKIGDNQIVEPKKPVELIYQHGVTKATAHPSGKTGRNMNSLSVDSATTNITTTKISVGGKVIDIDVLTKLQQNQRGNIVSFTASKEFLSNLANSKVKHITVQSTTSNEGNLFPIDHQTQGKKTSVIKSTQSNNQQDKILLPKTANSMNPTVNSVEVKRFAPEINGLLTGLSTALKTSSNKNIANNMHRDKSPIAPVAINVISPAKGLQAQKTALLLPRNLKEITHSSLTTTRFLPFNGKNPKTTILNQTTHPSIDLITKVKGRSKQRHLKHNTHVTFVPTFDEGRDKSRKTNKVLYENRNNSTFKIQKLMQNKMPYFKNNIDRGMNPNSHSGNKEADVKKISGFDELYKTAVKNVLNIKTFPDNFLKSGNKEQLKEFEEEFKQYLDTPMDIEKKINNGLFNYLSRKNKSQIDHNGGSHPKKIRLDVGSTVDNLAMLAESAVALKTSVKDEINSPQTTLQSNGSFTISSSIDEVEKRKFFSQFLNDHKDAGNPISHQYYSPADFPWMYPSYYQPEYFVMPSQTAKMPSQPPSPVPLNLSAQQQSWTIKEKSKTSKTNPAFTNGELSITESMNKVNKAQNKTLKKHTHQNKSLKSKSTLNSAKKSSLLSEKVDEKKCKRSERLKSINNRSTELSLQKLVSLRCSHPKLSTTPKKAKQKENLKFRYSLRQRLKALKKSKKTKKEQQERPKFVLKKLDKRTSTKKELFLACLGLRRILKRIDQSM